MRKDFVMPIAVLSLICLFMSGALAVTNSLTQPVIAAAAAERAETARRDILPHAESFILLEADGLPKTITAVYATTNNAGYLFMITVNGYGGEINLVCGIDADGKIIRTMTLAETETKGIATPVFAKEPLYIGKDRKLEGIDAVSGATITSNAYKNGILDAFDAFEIVRGMRG